MKNTVLLLVLGIIFSNTSFSQDFFDPKDTRIVIAGVLKWKDPSLASFSDHHRKDKELYEKFIAMGVPEANIVFLKDEEATLDEMKVKIRQAMKDCTEKSTFVFYYAGHGIKAKKKYFFCNYDLGAKTSSRFDVASLSAMAAKGFKGKRIILLADCCYSGALLAEGEKISKQKREVAVLSSATSSNISTGNWTFTQTLLDNLNGEKEGDRNNNGEISLEELAVEIKDAMKFRERQLNGFAVYGIDAGKTIVQKLKSGEKKGDKTQNGFTIDQYVYAVTKGNFAVGRIKDINAGDITIEFYDYSDKRTESIDRKNVRSIQFPDYSSLTKVQVEWEKKYYPATLKKTDSDFYYIQYDGYDAGYNEWVMYDRIKIENPKEVMVTWNNGQYKAEILQEKDGKYFIHYKGYSDTWDEWIEEDRIMK